VFSKCANPECLVSFYDYRQGRLFRFHQSRPIGSSPINGHSVTHFWLCSACSDIYTLECRECRAVLLTRRDKMPIRAHMRHPMTVA
jgi:hypothetical protein